MSSRVFSLLLTCAAFAFCAVAIGPASAQTAHKGPKPKMRPMGLPSSGNHYELKINGTTVAQFQEASGLQSESDVANYRNGGGNLSPRKVTGSYKTGDITLKRGVITGNSQLNDWLNSVRSNKHPKRRQITVVLYNEADQPIQVFKLKNATPKRWKGPGLNAKGNDRALEELVLSPENIEIVPPK